LRNEQIPADVLALVPEPIAHRHKVISFAKTKTELSLAMVDPTDIQTKEFMKMLSAFQDKVKTLGKKQMFLMPKKDETLLKASRNLPTITPTVATSLNITDVLRADSIVMTKDSLPVIEKTYLKVSAK
jgi:ribosomal protein L4